MIPLSPQPEPPHFDQTVRIPGHAWLQERQIPLDLPPPKAQVLHPYWQRCQKDLWLAYQGVCSYLCVFFDFGLGASSTDHFVAKASASAAQAYEWSNYRLACLAMNRNKGSHADLLDPFTMQTDTLVLNFADLRIDANRSLDPSTQQKASRSLRILRLNEPENLRIRQSRWNDYIAKVAKDGIPAEQAEATLRKEAPFVWYEAQRQGLLR